jgi:hypothetical protein
MDPDRPAEEAEVAELKERQRAQERAEREQLAGADTDAEARRHHRRADKAQYLRQKLEQRERADREVAEGDD